MTKQDFSKISRWRGGIGVLAALGLLLGCDSTTLNARHPNLGTTPQSATSDGSNSGADLATIEVEIINEPDVVSGLGGSLNGYRFTVSAREGSSCQSDVAIDRLGAFSEKNLSVQVPAACSYSVGLELGRLDDEAETLSEIFFSNLTEDSRGWPVLQSEIRAGKILKVSKTLKIEAKEQTGESKITGRRDVLGREILAYYSKNAPASGGQGSTSSFAEYGDYVHLLSPLWYLISSDGKIVHEDGGPNQGVLQQAAAKGAKVIPALRNAKGTSEFLASAAAQKQVVDEILDIVLDKKYDGINLLFSNIPASGKDKLTEFVNALSTRLHLQGKMLIVAVPPKVNPTSSQHEAYDYAALAAAADRIELRAIDYSNEKTSPGPVAPKAWVNENVLYALRNGVPANKMLLSVPTYGYEWLKSGGVNLVSTVDASKYVNNRDGGLNGAHYSWVEEVGCPKWSFDDRTIFLDNEHAAQFKFIAVARENLRGIGVWMLGSEQDSFWNFMEARFKKTLPPETAQ